MMCITRNHVTDEPLPDWEIHLTGLATTAEAALDEFLLFAPELAVYRLVAVRSEIAPPWSMYEPE